jgi:co-chaperonin GroES (HSP10)
MPNAFDEPIELAITTTFSGPIVLEGEYIPIMPFGKRVLVVRNPFRQMGNIIIPDKYRQPPTTGRILAIGPDIPKAMLRLGMQVCFGQYDGKEQAVVDSEGTVRTYVILHIDELVGELMVSTDLLRFPKGDGSYEP